MKLFHKYDIIGVDEAGKSSIIGPMIVAAIKTPGYYLINFQHLGIRDSKKINPRKRAIYRRIIEEKVPNISIIEVHPIEIDNAVFKIDAQHPNLNWLLLDGMRRAIINCGFTGKEMIYIDAPSIYYTEYYKWLAKELNTNRIIMNIKMDENNPIVSAASIIASDYRYQYIQELKESGVPIKNGECCDTMALEFAKNNPGSPLVRWSWKNVQDFVFD